MSLESLWRLLEQQGRTNASMASVVGLDEAKILVQDRAGAPKHGMTTIGKYPQNIFLYSKLFAAPFLNPLGQKCMVHFGQYKWTYKPVYNSLAKLPNMA